MAEKRRASFEKNSELIRLLQSIAKSESATICSNLATCEWSAEETNFFFKILQDYDYDYFPSNNFEDNQIYEKLSKAMISNGFKKSNTDINNYCSELKRKLANRISEELSNISQDDDLLEPQTDMVIIKGEEYDHDAAESQEESSMYEVCESKPGKGNRKNNWTGKETECVVQALEKYGMPNRNNVQDISLVVIDQLKQLGFTRSEIQVQIKMNQLRSLYNQVVQKRLKQDRFPFFHRMKKVVQLGKTTNKEEAHSFIPMDELSRSGELEQKSSLSDIQDDDSSIKKARQIWSNNEVQILLRFIADNNIVTGKQLRKMCNKAVDYLANYGYIRSPTQILIRWKNTKAVYWSTFRKKLMHPEQECTFFYQLHNIINPDDKSYDTSIFVASEDNKLISGDFEIIDPAKLSEGISFCLSKSPHSSVDSVSPKTMNSSVQNSVTSKRFPNSEVISEPLENSADIEVIPSSPKRSRTELSQFNPCSSCNTLDSVDHYCISLAHSIKGLDPRKQAKLKIEIQQLMYKAEFDLNF